MRSIRLRRVPEARRVRQAHRPAQEVDVGLDRIARGARDLGDQRPLGAEQRVEERGLAGVGPARPAPAGRPRAAARPTEPSRAARPIRLGSAVPSRRRSAPAGRGRRPLRESRSRSSSSACSSSSDSRSAAIRRDSPPSSWCSAARACAGAVASIRSPTASACTRSSLPLSTARRVNSPGVAWPGTRRLERREEPGRHQQPAVAGAARPCRRRCSLRARERRCRARGRSARPSGSRKVASEPTRRAGSVRKPSMTRAATSKAPSPVSRTTRQRRAAGRGGERDDGIGEHGGTTTSRRTWTRSSGSASRGSTPRRPRLRSACFRFRRASGLRGSGLDVHDRRAVRFFRSFASSHCCGMLAMLLHRVVQVEPRRRS